MHVVKLFRVDMVFFQRGTLPRQKQSEARRLPRKQPATDQARIRSQSHR